MNFECSCKYYTTHLAPGLNGEGKRANMKWGIIGPGSIAHDFVKDFDQLKTLQQVVSVLSHHEETAKEFAKEFSVQEVYTDLDKFVQETSAEIVYVATPHTKHYEEVKACLENGLHVLCEKPMGINHAQTSELYQLAKDSNVYLLEGMWLRFLPHIHRLKEEIDKGTIGKLISVNATMCYKAPKDPESRYYDPALGGGSLLDLGIYPVFLAIFLLGTPDRIRAIGHLTEKGVDDHCSILFGYDDGKHAILESSLLYNTELPAVVLGDEGTVSIRNPWFEKSPGLEIKIGADDATQWPTEWAGHGLWLEAEAVVEDIRNGRLSNALYSPGLSLDVIKVMDEIRKQVGIVYKNENSEAG